MPRNDPPRPVHRGPLPAGFLGLVAIVLLAESTVVRHELDLANVGAANYQFARKNWRKAIGADLVAMGDSQIKQGVLPEVLERTLGGHAYNLAIGGASAPPAFFLLRRLVESGARPEAIVVDFKARNLAEDPLRDFRGFAELLDDADRRDLARTAADPSLYGGFTVASILPSVRSRSEILFGGRRWLFGVENTNRYRYFPHWRNWRVNSGAQVNPKSKGMEDTTFIGDELPYILPDWRCHPLNAAYVTKFLDLAAAHAIRVVWLVPPMNPLTQAIRDHHDLDAPYAEYLRDTLASHPGLTLLDARAIGYPRALFADSCHLDRDGAARFSADLAAWIAERRRSGWGGSPRWSNLTSRAEAAPGALALEDVEQSDLALQERTIPPPRQVAADPTPARARR